VLNLPIDIDLDAAPTPTAGDQLRASPSMIVSDTGSIGGNGGPWFLRAFRGPQCWNSNVDKRTPSP
jgi:hypothetical protein